MYPRLPISTCAMELLPYLLSSEARPPCTPWMEILGDAQGKGRKWGVLLHKQNAACTVLNTTQRCLVTCSQHPIRQSKVSTLKQRLEKAKQPYELVQCSVTHGRHHPSFHFIGASPSKLYKRRVIEPTEDNRTYFGDRIKRVVALCGCKVHVEHRFWHVNGHEDSFHRLPHVLFGPNCDIEPS